MLVLRNPSCYRDACLHASQVWTRVNDDLALLLWALLVDPSGFLCVSYVDFGKVELRRIST